MAQTSRKMKSMNFSTLFLLGNFDIVTAMLHSAFEKYLARGIFLIKTLSCILGGPFNGTFQGTLIRSAGAASPCRESDLS